MWIPVKKPSISASPHNIKSVGISPCRVLIMTARSNPFAQFYRPFMPEKSFKNYHAKSCVVSVNFNLPNIFNARLVKLRTILGTDIGKKPY